MWWPTDLRAAHLASIEAWSSHSALANVRPAIALDVTQSDWRTPRSGGPLPEALAAIVCINVLHIAPWAATEGLLEGAGRRLARDGYVFIYGPFARDGAHVSPSNAAFDASLRAQDSTWGVRDTRDVAAAAANCGLTLAHVIDMPSNNITLVFEKSEQG
jgi:hypothetical protein